MGAEPDVDWALIGALSFGLFMFGIAFNGLVHVLGDRKRGYTSLLVVLGLFVVLGAAAIVDWRAALLVGGLFVPAGLPMIAGEVVRAIAERERERERVIRAMRDGHE